jgi:hypothetical protein
VVFDWTWNGLSPLLWAGRYLLCIIMGGCTLYEKAHFRTFPWVGMQEEGSKTPGAQRQLL